MSEEKHTPGPWEVFDNGLIFVKKDGHPICGCGTSFVGGGGECADWQVERNKANANLIAAAPEMLDALEDFVIALEGFFGFSEGDDMQPEDDIAYFIGEYRRAKHLIKKARKE